MKKLIILTLLGLSSCGVNQKMELWDQIEKIDDKIEAITPQRIDAEISFDKISQYSQEDLTEEGRRLQAELFQKIQTLRQIEFTLNWQRDSIMKIINQD